MFLLFKKYYAYMHNPFNSNQILEKELQNITCLTVFVCAFCHMCVENLLKGAETGTVRMCFANHIYVA